MTIPSPINGLTVTSIGDNAFNACFSLTSVTIPPSVTFIDNKAFIDCTSLTGVFFKGNAPSAMSNVFAGDYNLTAVYYLDGTTGWESSFGGVNAALESTPMSVPVITWAAPAAITYGTALSSAQLNATANVPGTFVYVPAAGTVPSAGAESLSLVFRPTNATDYINAVAARALTVNPAVPVITWAAPAAITYGTALSSSQLNATASVPGTFVYLPGATTVLAASSPTLSVTFTPTDSTDYTSATTTQTVTVTGLPDQAFLQQLFLDVLGRPIDSGALTSFGAALAGGESRAAALGGLLTSTEYTNRQIEPVIRLYYAAFARCPDYAGLQNWSNALQAGMVTLDGIGDQFASSAEFLQDYGSLNNTNYVQLLYLNVLGRQADPAGLTDWVDKLNGGTSRGTVLIGFSESPEFQADMANQVEVVRPYYLLLQRMPTPAELQSWIAFLNGDDQTDTLVALAYPSNLSNSAYVQAVFQGFLCRAADAGALSAFTAGLAAGTVTHGSLLDTVLNSTEFNTYVGPVSRLYLAAFNRIPDQPGLINWVNYAEAGNSLQSVADTFTASQEFINRYGAMSDTNYVTALYQNVLGRAPDPPGLTYWTGLPASGTSRGRADTAGLVYWTGQLASGMSRGRVLIGFSQSTEGINLLAPTLRTFLSYYSFLNAAPAQADLTYWNNYLTTLDDQMRENLLADITITNGS